MCLQEVGRQLEGQGHAARSAESTRARDSSIHADERVAALEARLGWLAAAKVNSKSLA